MPGDRWMLARAAVDVSAFGPAELGPLVGLPLFAAMGASSAVRPTPRP